MLLRWPTLSRLPIKVLAIRPTLHCIIVPEQPSSPQLGNKQLGDIDKSPRLDRIRNVEAIDIRLLDPARKFVCNLWRCTDDCGAESADGNVLSYCLLRPFGNAGRCLGPPFYCGPASVLAKLLRIEGVPIHRTAFDCTCRSSSSPSHTAKSTPVHPPNSASAPSISPYCA